MYFNHYTQLQITNNKLFTSNNEPTPRTPNNKPQTTNFSQRTGPSHPQPQTTNNKLFTTNRTLAPRTPNYSLLTMNQTFAPRTTNNKQQTTNNKLLPLHLRLMRQIQIIRHNHRISRCQRCSFGGDDCVLTFVFINDVYIGPVGSAAGVAEKDFTVLA